MKNNEFIKNKVMEIVNDYPISKVNLFGSRAAGTNREDSDVDLLVEFSKPVSLNEGDLPYEDEAMRAHAKEMVFPIGAPNEWLEAVDDELYSELR